MNEKMGDPYLPEEPVNAESYPTLNLGDGWYADVDTGEIFSPEGVEEKISVIEAKKRFQKWYSKHHIELMPSESVKGKCEFDAKTRKVKTTFSKEDKKEQKPKYCYLSEYEAGMGRPLVDAQILLGLKTCKTGGDVFGLLRDVRQHERDMIEKERLQGLKPRDEDSSFCSYCNVEMPVYREFMTVKRVYHCPECLRIDIKDFELGEQK